MSLNDWMPKATDLFFSVDRDPHIPLPNGYRIEPCIHVSDVEKRSLKERLFTKPWHPLTTHKKSARAYIVGKVILVSWTTYLNIKTSNEEPIK